jgi:aminoglycoside phosphotransferase (APT) family kinase protein
VTGDWWLDHQTRARIPPSQEGLGRMARALGSGARILRVRPLRGGIMSSAHAILVRMADGATRRLVLKRFPLSAEVARDEWRGLQLAQRSSVAPVPLLRAEAGEWFEEAALLTTFLPGRTMIPGAPRDLPERLGQLLATMHRSDVTGCAAVGMERFWSRSTDVGVNALPEVDEALDRVSPFVDRGSPALVHGDFWMGNVIWRGGRVSGVVDWNKACVGPRGYDVGHARLDLALVWGSDAAERFTAAYTRHAGPVPDLPVWDLVCTAGPMWAEWWLRGYHALGRSDIALDQIRTRMSAWIARALDQVDHD